MKDIRFKPSVKQYQAWGRLEDNVTEEVFYGGAAGGGKSYMGCYWKVYRRLRYEGSRGLTGRSVLKDITESTLITYFKVLRDCNLVEGVDYTYNAQRYYIEFSNGSREVFKDLAYLPRDPDYQRLGSSEYTDAWIEEAGDGIPEKALEILKTRIRWNLDLYGITPTVLITGNPGYYWARNRYIYDEDNNVKKLPVHQCYIPALVDDNPDKGFVDIYKKSLSNLSSDYDRQRLLYGDWNAVEKTGAEFYPKFDYQKHTAELEFNPDLPLHITFDFNKAPHMTLLIIQCEDKDVRLIDEICLKPPKSTTKQTCQVFSSRYKDFNDVIYLYGDPSGIAGDTRSEHGHNDYTIIKRELSNWPVKYRVQKSAPSPTKRGEFINDAFENELHGINITINRNCPETIADFTQTRIASDGRKDKRRITDPTLKISYEPNGHETDAFEYFICAAYSQEFNKYVKGGKSGRVRTVRRKPKQVY